MSQSAMSATRNEATRRFKPPKSDDSCRTHSRHGHTALKRTVADVKATLSEHTLNPQTPEWKGNPCYAFGKNLVNYTIYTQSQGSGTKTQLMDLMDLSERWVRGDPNWMDDSGDRAQNKHEIAWGTGYVKLSFDSCCLSMAVLVEDVFFLWIGWPHVTPAIVSKERSPTSCLLDSGFCSSTCWFMFKSKSVLDLDRSWDSWVRAGIVEGSTMIVIT